MRHTEYDQYDRSRARECLGLALGFLMNYGELWSSNRVPFRIAERREDCGEKNANQAPEIPNSGCHHIESHRHIDISTWHVPRTSFLCQELSYMMWFLFRNVPIQELSHLMWWNIFRFVLFRNHHIWCGFFSVIFLFRNFHIWCDLFFRFFPFQERSYLMWFLFRNCPFQELSHFMYFFQICSVSGRIAFDMVFFSFQVTLETGAAFLFGLLRGRLRCTICLLTV